MGFFGSVPPLFAVCWERTPSYIDSEDTDPHPAINAMINAKTINSGFFVMPFFS